MTPPPPPKKKTSKSITATTTVHRTVNLSNINFIGRQETKTRLRGLATGIAAWHVSDGGAGTGKDTLSVNRLGEAVELRHHIEGVEGFFFSGVC